MRIVKTSRMAALALVASAVIFMAVGIPEQASAAGVTGVATPIQGIPTSIATGAGYTSAGGLGNSNVAAMSFLYKLATTPELQAAVKSKAAGTTTTTEAQLLASAAKSARWPAVAGTLVKGANVAGVAYTGYQIGGAIGAPIAGKITQSLWGEDANNLVCSVSSPGIGQTLVSFFAHQNCAKFNAGQGYTANADASGGYSMAPITVNGYQWTLTTTLYGYAQGNTYVGGYCGTTTADLNGPGYNGAGVMFQGPDGKFYGARMGITNPPNGQTACGGSFTQGAVLDPLSGLFTAAGLGPASSPEEAAKFAGKFTPRCLYDEFPVSGNCDGSPNPITVGSANPSRYMSCDITGDDGHTYSTAGAAFTEADADWTPAIPQCPTLDAGVLPASTKIVLHTVGGDDQTLWSHDLDPAVTKQISGQHATCAETACDTRLYEADGTDCFDGDQAQCAGWFADPDKATKYRCKYDGETLALSDCNVYAPTFEPDVQTGTSTEIYGDPYTGKATPASPNAQEAAVASPSIDQKLYNSPLDDPDDVTKKCFASTFGSFNPIQWVMRPVQCSLQWAFVPRTSAVNADLATLQTKAEGTTAGQLQAAVAAWSFHQPSGCAGIRIDVSFLGPPFYIGNACPGSSLAILASWSSIFAGLAAVILGFVSIRRSIGAVAQFNA